MTFEAVRQIVESRLFGISVAQQTFTTGDLDNIRTASAFSGLSTATLVGLNPTYLDFPTDALITVTGNSTGATNDEIKIEGWNAGDLNSVDNILTSLVLVNSFGAGVGSQTFNEFLIVRSRSETATVEEKIADWVSVINGLANSGITAEADGTDSFRLIPVDRSADNIRDGSLSIDTSGPRNFCCCSGLCKYFRRKLYSSCWFNAF